MSYGIEVVCNLQQPNWCGSQRTSSASVSTAGHGYDIGAGPCGLGVRRSRPAGECPSAGTGRESEPQGRRRRHVPVTSAGLLHDEPRVFRHGQPRERLGGQTVGRRRSLASPATTWKRRTTPAGSRTGQLRGVHARQRRRRCWRRRTSSTKTVIKMFLTST